MRPVFKKASARAIAKAIAFENVFGMAATLGKGGRIDV